MAALRISWDAMGFVLAFACFVGIVVILVRYAAELWVKIRKNRNTFESQDFRDWRN